MFKNFKIFLVGVIVIGTVLGLISSILPTQAVSKPLARKIIVFKAGILNESTREALVKKFGGVKIKDLTLINGKVVLLPPEAEAALVSQPGILRIDDDIIVEALVKNTAIKPQLAEVLPWGIDRIDAEKVWATTTADLIKVAIIDTGISVTHPDLKGNLKGGYNAINPRKSTNDDNGHGSHVAGIVAAVDNEIGVIGVGPNIDLYAVKVLDRNGSGYLSDVIEGLDWAIKNKMQVVNMSLGTASNVLSFQEAVERVNAAGIVQVAAAGNSGGAVIYPAAYPEVIAISATDQNNVIASWSSRGPEVDLAAPGVSIYSTYKGQLYKTLSGTSMASPHVAGTAALLLSMPSKCDFNGDLICSPAEVQQRLEATAIKLGTTGKDNLYGSGLVNAFNAVTQ